MKSPCTASQLSRGECSVRHIGSEVGTVEVTARSQQAALKKMRGELRYQLKICPCTGEMYRVVQIEFSSQVETQPVIDLPSDQSVRRIASDDREQSFLPE